MLCIHTLQVFHWHDCHLDSLHESTDPLEHRSKISADKFHNLKSLSKSFGTSRGKLSMTCISEQRCRSHVPSANWLMNVNNTKLPFSTGACLFFSWCLCCHIFEPAGTCGIGRLKRRYWVCPIIQCCNNTTPYWIIAPPILFYMVPCKEGNLCACNTLGKHQPLVKRNISFESYEWALFIKVALFH